METVSARRELAIVVALAVLGLCLVLVVAFAPWYASSGYDGAGARVVETVPPKAAAVAVR
ncbi:hypothetical protein [Actinoplanes sp. NPDC049316]|uniref:hypothetical protein n=1 Tax=Actinoplanes sp. NPDC049316 TaxID=3154727 RepID=UPI0034151CA9